MDYIGIDLHKNSGQVCIPTEDGELVERRVKADKRDARALMADDKLDSVTAEIFVIKADGKGKRERLTNNAEEERAPQWSPDGKRIAYMCRKGGSDFEICVMNADGTGQRQLTDNTLGDLTCAWSPGGQKIVFHRQPAREAGEARGVAKYQLWTIDGDGAGEMKLTDAPGHNGFPSWGEVRVPGEKR